MDHGVIGMPFDMAMGDEVSRRQFYSRAQAVLAERDELRADLSAVTAERDRLLRFTQQMARQQGEPYFQRLARAAMAAKEGV